MQVPSTMEIVLVPREAKCGQYPGLFLFTNAARMMRPVINLAAQKVEMIGTFEQVSQLSFKRLLRAQKTSVDFVHKN